MRKWILVLIFIILIIVGYKYIYQEHRNIEKEQPVFVMSSSLIINAFLEEPLQSEKKYLNKTIAIIGVITEISVSHITLDGFIFCQFSNIIPQNLKMNDSIKIKGRCIGYDDLLEQVKLDQCSML